MKSDRPHRKAAETAHEQVAPAKTSRARKLPKRRRWVRVCLVVFALLLLAAWLGREPATKLVESTVVEHLNQNGVYPRYARRSWSPWSGLHLEQLTLYRNAAGAEPIIEVSSLDVRFPWYRIWKARTLISRWHLYGATVTLHDAAGAITFQNVISTAELQGGEITVQQIQFSQGAIRAMLSGQILFTVQPNPPPQNPQDFLLDLGVVRAVQATLDIKPNTGPFFIHGTFAVDSRDNAGTWQTELDGSGKSVVWRDVPLPEVDTHAQLSQQGLSVTGNLHFTHGSGTLKASRADWDRSPLVVTGQIADPGGRKDEVSASYNGDSHLMMLASIRGRANLLEFAHSFPALARVLPSGVELRTVPEMSLTKLMYHEGQGSWSLESWQLHSPADLTVDVNKHPLAIDHLLGRASFDGREWRFSDVSGLAVGGRFSISGAYAEGEAREAKLEISGWHVKDLGPWLGGRDEALGDSQLSLDYHGTLGLQATRWSGAGSIHLENAPVVKVPLLDETYALFGALSPGVKRSGTGDLKSTFAASKGVFEVSQLTATGEAVNVTGNGVVDFVKGQVNGHARGNLRGVPGIATSLLSRALEMKVSGPLDHIQVQPEGPLGVAGEGIAGAAELPGKVLKEGVTLPIKIFDWLGGKPSDPKKKP